MNSVSTARIAIGNLQAETGLAFQMVYLKGSDCEQSDLIDSLQGRVATTQILSDGEGYALAVIPRNWAIDPPALQEEFGRDLHIANDVETEQSLLRGIPITIASARERGIDLILEQSLACLPSVYLETVHPHLLIHLDGESFRRLFYGSWCGCISHAREPVRSACGTG